jgi:tetratricopeptide (TPR) repeat protein
MVNAAAYELYMRSFGGPSMIDPAQLQVRAERLRRAVWLDPTFARAYARLARVYLFLGYGKSVYIDSGLTVARKAIALDPELALGHFALGALQGERGQLTESRALFRKAHQLDPNLAGALSDLAVTEDFLGRYDEALHWGMRALPLAPNVPSSYYHVAGPLLRLGDDAACERFLAQAERQFPDAVRLQLQLSVLDVLRGRDVAAMDRARRMVARHPEDQERQWYLGELAVITGAPDAEALLAPMARAGPDSRSYLLPESFRTLYAWTLARRGERARADSLWSEALAAARRDVARGHEKPDRPIELAAISAVRGDTAAALEWLEHGYRAGWRDNRVLARDPLFDGVRAHPRFRQLVSRMQQDVATMRRRAAAEHDTLFRLPPTR